MFRLGPAPLKGPFDSTGFPVGCKSACLAGLGGDPGKLFLPHPASREGEFDGELTSLLRSRSQQLRLLHGLARHPGDVPRVRRGLLLVLQGQLPELVRVRVR